ncbi:MAG: chloride channel protein [Caldilineaceae bacterium]
MKQTQLHNIYRILRMPFRHLPATVRLADYFDAHERRLVVMAIVVGAVVWGLAYSLKSLVHWLGHTTQHALVEGPTPLLLFVPLVLGSLLVAWLVSYRASVVHYRDKQGHIHELLDVEGDGLERAIALYYAAEPQLERALLGKEGVDVRWTMPTLSLALRKFVATLITLGSGGSGGLEASVTLIGESMAVALFKPRRPMAASPWAQRLWQWWRARNADDLQTAQLSGIAAAVATLLGAPLAAAFFAVEIMYRRRPVIEKLIYALIAALVAYFLSNIVSGGHTTIFEVEQPGRPPLAWSYYAAVSVMALFISMVATYFRLVHASFDRGFHHYLPNRWVRHVTGAIGTGAIALVAMGLSGYGPELILGTGESVIYAAMAGEVTLRVALIALVAKLFATLTTITSGGSAGLLIPSLFFGTMVAVIVALLFGYAPLLLIIPAVTATLVALVNVPLAAILLTVELFGAPYILPALVALVVAMLLTHETSVYRTQRERDESREILPGYSVRRLPIPSSWAGRSLAQLGVRARFDVNVIGMIEAARTDQRILPHLPVQKPLRVDDLLIVLGENEKLAAMEAAMQEESLR